MRHVPATKRTYGKLKRFRNLKAFNAECPSRGISGNRCTVTNVRCTRDGGGLATVQSRYPVADTTVYRHGAKPTGTWLLKFASCAVMKQHLNGRVEASREGMLQGQRRKRRR